MTALEILESTDWAHLLHAYGPADVEADTTRALLGDDPAAMMEAVEVLQLCFLRRGTISPATPAALRFVLAVLDEWDPARFDDPAFAEVYEELSIFTRDVGFVLRRCQQDIEDHTLDESANERMRALLDAVASKNKKEEPAADEAGKTDAADTGEPTAKGAAAPDAHDETDPQEPSKDAQPTAQDEQAAETEQVQDTADEHGKEDQDKAATGAEDKDKAEDKEDKAVTGADATEPATLDPEQELAALSEPLIYNAGVELMGLTDEVLKVMTPRVTKADGHIDLDTLDTLVPWLVLPEAEEAHNAVLTQVCEVLDSLDATPERREERLSLVQVIVDLREDMSGLSQDEDPAVRVLAAISKPDHEGAVQELVKALVRMTEDNPEEVYGQTWSEIRNQADSAIIRVQAPLEEILPAALARIRISTGLLPDHDWLPLVTHCFPPSGGEPWERLLPEEPTAAQLDVLEAVADNDYMWDDSNSRAAVTRSYMGLGEMSRQDLRDLISARRAVLAEQATSTAEQATSTSPEPASADDGQEPQAQDAPKKDQAEVAAATDTAEAVQTAKEAETAVSADAEDVGAAEAAPTGEAPVAPADTTAAARGTVAAPTLADTRDTLLAATGDTVTEGTAPENTPENTEAPAAPTHLAETVSTPPTHLDPAPPADLAESTPAPEPPAPVPERPAPSHLASPSPAGSPARAAHARSEAGPLADAAETTTAAEAAVPSSAPSERADSDADSEARVIDHPRLSLVSSRRATSHAKEDSTVSSLFSAEPMTQEDFKAIQELVTWTPENGGSRNLRIVAVHSETARARLLSHLTQTGRDQAMSAPSTLIVAGDPQTGGSLPNLDPQGDHFRALVESGGARLSAQWARARSLVQVDFLLEAIRAIGLAVAPIGNEDTVRLAADFFPSQEVDVLAVLAVGHPVRRSSRGRHAGPSEEVYRIV